jgi:hypothetical protein
VAILPLADELHLSDVLENPKGEIEPFLMPLVLDLPSSGRAREIFGQVVRHPNVPVHSVALTSEDAGISERWFQIVCAIVRNISQTWASDPLAWSIFKAGEHPTTRAGSGAESES